MIESLKALRAQKSPLKLFEFKEDDPRRARPISLEQQKKQSKELLTELKSKHSAALKRAAKSFSHNQSEYTLSKAQHIIAQENGFKKWTDLKAFAEHSDIARKAISSNEPQALDQDLKTLHIRCGSDIMHALAIAGFEGDFLNFSDPYVHGPVTNTDSLNEFIELRADFLKKEYQLRNEKFEDLLLEDYIELSKAKHYDRACIWLEHDSYDQLILARLLDFFSDAKNRPGRLEMINITHFPGVSKFHSIGSLPPEAMRVLWKEFKPISDTQLALGKQAWKALTSPTPKLMSELVLSNTPEIPTLAKAFRRHLQELPSTENGLGLTAQQTLQALYDRGPMNAEKLFHLNNNHYEYLTYMGDLQYWWVLKGLSDVENPAIAIKVNETDKKLKNEPDRNHYNNRKHWHITLTTTGKKLLRDETHWLRLNKVIFWVGGTKIDVSTGKAWTIRRSDQSLVEISV